VDGRKGIDGLSVHPSVDVTLSRADLDPIERFAPHGVAAGDRYTPEMQRLLNG
jgi:hypothetical protein